jgi:type IX secretion system PorP/SprF family membrane protein
MKKIKSFISLAVITCLAAFNAISQQEYQFANTVNNPFLLNPAAGGLTDVMHFEASTRMQWLGYEGGPRTVLISGNSQINFNKSGENVISEFNVRDEKLFKSPEITTGASKHIIGGKVWNDAIGPFSKTAIQGSYAYHLRLNKKLNFGVGIGLGYSNFRLNESKVTLFQEDDNTYTQFLGNSSQQNIADAQAGFVVYGERFFFGLSGTQLLKNKVVLNQVLTESNFDRHYFIVTKYKLINSGDITIEPSLIAKFAKEIPVSIDLGARVIYKNSSWFGLQFRTNSSLIFQVGSNLIKNLYLNYSYEYSMGKLRTAGNSTHEIQLGYYLGKNRNVDKEIKQNSEKAE